MVSSLESVGAGVARLPPAPERQPACIRYRICFPLLRRKCERRCAFAAGDARLCPASDVVIDIPPNWVANDGYYGSAVERMPFIVIHCIRSFVLLEATRRRLRRWRQTVKLYRCYLCRDDGAAIAWRAFASRDIGDVQVRAVKLLAGVPHAKCIEGRARST